LAINFGLAGEGFDGLQVLQTYGQAQTQRLNDLKAQRAIRDDNRRETTQQGLIAAYDPQTGAVDPVAARGAYLAGGDVSGAMAFDQSRVKAQQDTLDSQLKRAQATTALLSSSTDPATYAANRGRAQALGLDLTGVPDQFDPQWVQSATMQALSAEERLKAQLAREKFQADQAARERDDARADRVANNGIATSNARLGLAREARGEGRVRFRERDKDRAALAASGGIRTDLSDLDY